MTINWWTIALQTANFLVLVWLLYRLLYKPVREVIDKRKALVAAAMDEAKRTRAEADAARARYERECAKLAGENEEKLRVLHREAEVERAHIVAAAEREAERLVSAAHTRIAEEREAALSDLHGQAVSLAADLAADILAKNAPEATGEAFLTALEQRLKTALPEERDRLRRDLAQDQSKLEIATAAPLTAEQQERWQRRLVELLGRIDRISFVADPALVGGAEVRFPHAVLGLTWRDQLEGVKRALAHDKPAA